MITMLKVMPHRRVWLQNGLRPSVRSHQGKLSRDPAGIAATSTPDNPELDRAALSLQEWLEGIVKAYGRPIEISSGLNQPVARS